MKPKAFISSIGTAIKQNKPRVVSGLSVIGVLGTAALSGIGSWKACKKVETIKREKGVEHLTFKETLKAVWPFYISPVVVGGSTIAGIIASDKMHAKKEAGLAAACGIAEAAIEDFTKKTEEVVGEKKVQEIRDAIAQDQVEKDPLKVDETPISVGPGGTLCKEAVCGRYFYSDMETLRRIENRLNYRLNFGEPCLPLNAFYDELHMPHNNVGGLLGWNVTRDGLIEFHFSSQITSDGEPCLVVNFGRLPKTGYDLLG